MRAISASRPSKNGGLDRGIRSRCFCRGNADFFGRFAILGLRSTGDNSSPVPRRTLSCANEEGVPHPAPLLLARVGNLPKHVFPGALKPPWGSGVPSSQTSRVDGCFSCDMCSANPLTPLSLLKVRFRWIGLWRDRNRRHLSTRTSIRLDRRCAARRS